MSMRKFVLSSGSLTIAAGWLVLAAAPVQAATVLTVNDGVIRNSLCVGTDCGNSPSFSDTTILLMENNTRIKFDDTSNSASFPNNDWEIEANSNANGGQAYLGINDCGVSSQGGCTSDLVFAIEAGARANSLYVDDAGRVGLGTSTPSVELHIVDGNTPTLRLDQNASSGFAAQVWDVAGNETNFFVRDVTNSSRLPFKIRPGAATNSIVIDPEGDVGIGTSTPAAGAQLHVRQTDGTAKILVEEASGTTANNRILLTLENNGASQMALINSNTGSDWRFQNFDDQFRVNKAGTGVTELTLDNAGNMTILGTLTEGSDKNAKMAIEPVDHSEILDKIASLDVSAWTYKRDADTGIRHIGPMAQDFHALFGLGANETGISTLDTSGVALAAIKALEAKNSDQRRLVDTILSQNADQRLLIEAILIRNEALLARIEALEADRSAP